MRGDMTDKILTSLGKVVDIVWLSILWLLCCLPVVTIGASSTALYYTVHKTIRGSRGYTTRTFFTALKDNFKQATLSYLVWLLVMIVLVADLMITREVLKSGNTMGMFFYCFLVMIAFAVGWGCYLFSYTARFANTVKATVKNAFLLELRHLPWSLLIICITAAALFATWLLPVILIFLPALLFLIYDLILERLFRRYMSEEDLAKELENDMIDRM